MVMQQVEILRAACCIAAADKRIEESEAAYLRRLASEAGVGKMSLQAMIDRATHEPDFFREQFRVLLSDPETTMNLLIRVAIADQELSDAECRMLEHFASVLGMTRERFQQYLAAGRKAIASKRQRKQ